METKPHRCPSDAMALPRYRYLGVHQGRAPGAKSMRTKRLIAAAAFAVAAFVAVPTAEAIAQSTSVETQSSVKNCRYYYHGRYWRHRAYGGYYHHHWHGRYYRR
jgi:hypothetical protein